MKKLKILKYPNSFLKKVGKPVPDNAINNALHDIINEMFSIMYELNGGGLAATQVGLDMRIFIMDNSKNKDQPIVAINPKIIEKEGEIYEEEGCLSFPGVIAKVKRSKWVKMNALNIFGKQYELKTNGYLSRCIQHELDHLNGITYFDHLSTLKRSIIEKKYKKLLKSNTNV